MTDWDLLHRFAHQRSEEAFAELVHRHLNFVYSCARRQVRSPQLAQEVAQTVFLDLARQAARLEPGAPLTAWLYLVTRRTALNTVRAEQRRQAREHAAYELSAMNTEPGVWAKLEPLLDEALETLQPRDRSAILLRYFENQPLREVGAALGASEDAAQKRVSRALDELRRWFARHGVAVTATGLATHLSAHAVEAAPAALGPLISTTTASALVASASSPALAVAQATVMTALQKILLAGALVALAASVYELRTLAADRAQLAGLDREATALSAREVAARRDRDAAVHQLATLRADLAQAAATPAPPAGDPAIATMVARTERLKQRFAAEPQLRVPEMALLNEADWFAIARERALDTDADLRASLARLRGQAKGLFISSLSSAFVAFVQAHEGRLPETPRDLLPHLKTTLDSAALDAALLRYELKPRGSITDVPDKAILILERAAPIDPDYDTQLRVTRILSESDTDPLKINRGSDSIGGRLAPKTPMFLR